MRTRILLAVLVLGVIVVAVAADETKPLSPVAARK